MKIRVSVKRFRHDQTLKLREVIFVYGHAFVVEEEDVRRPISLATSWQHPEIAEEAEEQELPLPENWLPSKVVKWIPGNEFAIPMSARLRVVKGIIEEALQTFHAQNLTDHEGRPIILVATRADVYYVPPHLPLAHNRSLAKIRSTPFQIDFEMEEQGD